MNQSKDRSAYKRAYRAANLERERAYGRDYNRKNKEKRKAYRKLYSVKNKEKLSATQRKWKDANPEAFARYSQKRREASAGIPRKTRKDKLAPAVAKERLIAAHARYREKNREECRLGTAKRRAANPAKARAQWLSDVNRRRARKLNAATGDLKLIARWEQDWRSKARVTCYWCGSSGSPKKCNSDHILALKKGGAHTVENLCIACKPCNSRKSAKSLEDWNRQIAEPVLF